MNIILKRTNTEDADFGKLVEALDADLRFRDGDDHLFYAQLNKTHLLQHALVAYANGIPVGSGALKPFSETAMEVKRMYVVPEQRSKGIASQILAELENWVRELNFTHCVLETGKNQPEALALYAKNGYTQIPNYGKYAGVYNSICFEKKIV